MHLWKPDSANPLRNLLWASERMNLYDSIDNGKVSGINEDAVRMIVEMLSIAPMDMSLDNQRPYDTECVALNDVEQYIANAGQEQLPQFKPGRFEYPRNAVYY